VREEQNNSIIFSSERKYFRDLSLKNTNFHRLAVEVVKVKMVKIDFGKMFWVPKALQTLFSSESQ